MEMMKAVRIYGYGDRNALVYEDAPCPEVAQDEVFIRIVATSVNPFDWAVRNGYLANYYSYTFPHTLGLDVAGVVAGFGSEVQGFSEGDVVFTRAHPSRNGAYAEYISVPAIQVAPKPQSLDPIQAAGVPHAAVSAWRALVDAGQVASGQTVLIHGAAGGVGSTAVQIAKCLGGQVIGTSSDYNLEFLRELGVDEAVDYNKTRFESVVHDVDLVLDLIGDAGDNTQQRSWQVIKPGGVLISLVQYPDPGAAAAHNVRSMMVGADICDTQTLNEISRWIDGGQLRTTVSHVYPLSEAREAHELSESRHVRGKIILQVADA